MSKSKIILAFVLTFSVLFIAGCSQKESKLVCTQTTSGIDIEFNVGFKGNVIKSMDFNYDMDLSKYSDTQIKAIGKQDFCSTVKNYMSQFKDAFSNCKQDIGSDKHLKVAADFEVDKLTKSYLDKISTPAKTKKELEASGYKCTIK